MQKTIQQKSRWAILLISLLAWLETGCVAVLSDRVRQEADRQLTFVQVRRQPEAYIGRLIIVGGDIVRATHVPGLTFLEVVQKPLDSGDRPQLTDQSEGRFMARCEGHLDPRVYTSGGAVSLAGRVLGTHIEQIGDTAVPYPLLSCLEIYVWPPPIPLLSVSPGIGYWWGWDPWYWDPWYRHHHHYEYFWGRRPRQR